MKRIILAFTVCLASIFTCSAYAHSSNFTDTTGYSDYVGKYKFPEGSFVDEIEVAVQDTSLMISAAQGTSPLTKLGVDSFSLDAFNGIVVFKRDETSKQVKSIDISVAGMSLVGEKQPAETAWMRKKAENVLAKHSSY